MKSAEVEQEPNGQSRHRQVVGSACVGVRSTSVTVTPGMSVAKRPALAALRTLVRILIV
jgi:hypothetical protein